ncbi:UDP-N-acetylglucosamine--undecaprenyl-phosphate N-acetylglucosaminephosphotransferase [Vibrio zhugei]|uniref:Undecaprenyl-phosphate alpha-N-acetylglucosaminyl 1-phosphate transferase n=1 Tax=Vibrio zhugei TaxID=2479546 RepID=A0ABV7C742_9VIBR|nr:UDP-N-acetylglucosamine--undecaprenyl-phosphate N-acetylglucosaminephosphotransferase [Vibrio zhugei]
MIMEIVIVFFLSFTSLFITRKIAKKIGLVDKPDFRKRHKGAVPLVGGVALYLVTSLYLFFNPNSLAHTGLYFFSITSLIIVGVLDDKFDISFKLRLGVQAGLAILLMTQTGLSLDNLGNLFGYGDITLGYFGYLFTIFAVIGAINAFNMVDGIDGLLGGLSVVTFSALAIMLSLSDQHWAMGLCFAIIVAMVPYICMNLGILGHTRKVFMGDAGSMMIGMTVIWLLIGASQDNGHALMRPITAVWVIAIPLMDMAAIMIRRLRRGHSPFKPDRGHLHHICQRLGLSPHQTLAFICTIAAVFAGFGIYGEIANISEQGMFITFVICFLIYAFTLAYIWRITAFIKRLKGKEKEVYIESQQGM